MASEMVTTLQAVFQTGLSASQLLWFGFLGLVFALELQWLEQGLEWLCSPRSDVLLFVTPRTMTTRQPCTVQPSMGTQRW